MLEQDVLDWAKTEGSYDFSKVNFSWMKELLNFDYWSAPQPNGKSPQMCHLIALPDLDTHIWAKLRLLKGKAEANIGEAVKEVRHLAYLQATWNTAVSTVTGRGLYSLEKKVFEVMPASKRPDNWKPQSSDEIIRHGRFLYVYSFLLRRMQAMPLEIVDAIYFNQYSATGLCAAINEAYEMFAVIDLFKDRYSSELHDRAGKLKSYYGKNCNSNEQFLTRIELSRRELSEEFKSSKIGREAFIGSLEQLDVPGLVKYEMLQKEKTSADRKVR